jgi:hypothetical protein
VATYKCAGQGIRSSGKTMNGYRSRECISQHKPQMQCEQYRPEIEIPRYIDGEVMSRAKAFYGVI